MKCPDCMALLPADTSDCPDCGHRFSVVGLGPTVGLVSDDRLLDGSTSGQTSASTSDERADSASNHRRD